MWSAPPRRADREDQTRASANFHLNSFRCFGIFRPSRAVSYFVRGCCSCVRRVATRRQRLHSREVVRCQSELVRRLAHSGAPPLPADSASGPRIRRARMRRGLVVPRHRAARALRLRLSKGAPTAWRSQMLRLGPSEGRSPQRPVRRREDVCLPHRRNRAAPRLQDRLLQGRRRTLALRPQTGGPRPARRGSCRPGSRRRTRPIRPRPGPGRPTARTQPLRARELTFWDEDSPVDFNLTKPTESSLR